MRIREIIVNKTIPTNFSFSSYTHVPEENYLFFDIETLGFHRHTHPVAMIGIMIKHDNTWIQRQWICDSLEDEPAMLESFFAYITEKTVLISFNGMRFDWPFLSARAKKHRILPPSYKKHIDLYQFYRGGFAHLDVKTHTLRELTKTDFQFFSVESREIPHLLHQHIAGNVDDESIKSLFSHNEEDLWGLLALEDIMEKRSQNWQIRMPAGTLTLLSIRANDDYYVVRYLPSNQSFPPSLMTQHKNYLIDWIQADNELVFKFRYLAIDHQETLIHLLPDPWFPFRLPENHLAYPNQKDLQSLHILRCQDALDPVLIHAICRKMALNPS